MFPAFASADRSRAFAQSAAFQMLRLQACSLGGNAVPILGTGVDLIVTARPCFIYHFAQLLTLPCQWGK